MIYLISSIIWIVAFTLFPKYKEKQNIWRSLILSIMSYECYLCLFAGIMTVIRIPVDIYTISLVNLLAIAGMICYMWRNRKIQKYYIKLMDSVFILGIAVLIGYLMLDRFTVDMKIVFQTIDPSAHISSTMDFVRNKTLKGMYVSQLMNGLMIEGLGGIFTNEFVYKSYIIQYGLNFFMAAAVFWSVVERYGTNIIMKLIVYAATVAYVLGYPYNDMLYGFTYLQVTVTLVCYIIALIQDYYCEEEKPWLWELLISMGCLAVGIGYTLFAPPVYIAVFLSIIYREYQKGRPLKKIIVQLLRVFALPSVMTVFVTMIAAQIGDKPIYYIGALGVEGEAYRNLYSDFLLFSIPAVYGFVATLKKKKVNILAFLIPVFGMYYVGAGILMLCDKLSTYYFYKLNYMTWMLVLVLFVMGMRELLQLDKKIFGVVLSGILLLTAIYISGKETVYQNSDKLYLPYADSGAFFRIYTCNREFRNQPIQKSEDLVDICGVVDENYSKEKVIFIGYWENSRWYDALTNQDNEDILGQNCAEMLARFYNGELGEYAVVEKNSEGIDSYKEQLTKDSIYENNFAYIVRRVCQ